MLSASFLVTSALVANPTQLAINGGLRVAPMRAPDSRMLFGQRNAAAATTPTMGAPVTEREVRAAQANWASAIKRISASYLKGGDFVKLAGEAAGELYGYGHHNVLFKPTKAAERQFRPTAEDALSYFVGGAAGPFAHDEDGGFAINGGKGWKKVSFDNHAIALKGDVAIAMGNYYFTCATTGDEAKVEYTLGYQRCDDGEVRIFLHHSSVPFAG